MDIGPLKEEFADILIAFQRGEIDLPDALTQVRGLEYIPEEVPEFDDEDEDDDGDGDGGDDGAGTPPGNELPEPPDPEALEAAAAELDAALALVPGAAPA